MLSSGRTEPAALARNKLSRSLSPYLIDDVRYVPTLEETLDRTKHVTLEQIKALYETQIGGSHAELGVVGDFDPEPTLRLVKEMLSGWESKVPYKRIDHKVANNGTGLKEEIVTPDKSNAEYLAGFSFPVSDSDPDYPRCGSATSSSAAARSPLESATGFARRTASRTAPARRSSLHPSIRWPR